MDEPSRASEKVIVVGAGIAGLHAAYRLYQAGVDVTVYEASKRAGGRMYSARGQFSDGQVCELGGELIDSGHRFIWGLVSEFGLHLDDRLKNTPEDYVVDTWFVQGRVVSEGTLLVQYKQVAPKILEDLQAADADEAAFDRLDQTPLDVYLEQVAPRGQFPELNAVLAAAYVGEFGLEVAEQSALNLIYLIDAEQPEPFRIFGESDERYHIHGGNEQLPQALAARLGGAIQYDRRLVAAKRLDDGYTLTFVDERDRRFAKRCDRLVLALPFSTLRNVELEGLGLSPAKRQMIRDLGYGTNTKLMGGFGRRVWREDYAASGSVTTDLPLQQTWDTSIGQDGQSGILTNFLGGDQGLEAGKGEPDAWYQHQLSYLEGIFPGVSAAYVPGSAVRMYWPKAPFALGSYTCYRPGQWSFWGKEGLAEGLVHFCGEHTSAEFQGWMEGGAESGARVALEVLKALGRPVPKELAQLVGPESAEAEAAEETEEAEEEPPSLEQPTQSGATTSEEG